MRPSTSLADDDAEVEQFIVDKQERLTPAIPLGKISYLVAPRELPPLTSFSVRVDSSLAESTVIPEDEVAPIAKDALGMLLSPPFWLYSGLGWGDTPGGLRPWRAKQWCHTEDVLFRNGCREHVGVIVSSIKDKECFARQVDGS